jgi:hypothetical protein
MYYIYGKNLGSKSNKAELLDKCKDMHYAFYLEFEYRMAFGKAWKIWTKQK